MLCHWSISVLNLCISTNLSIDILVRYFMPIWQCFIIFKVSEYAFKYCLNIQQVISSALWPRAKRERVTFPPIVTSFSIICWMEWDGAVVPGDSSRRVSLGERCECDWLVSPLWGCRGIIASRAERAEDVDHDASSPNCSRLCNCLQTL